MTQTEYISVILPLKLEWEPYYALPHDINPKDIMTGDRVKVRFANKVYSGVVSKVGVIPDTDIDKIKPIICIEDGMERIFKAEIELWRKVSEYYLCTIGEVYKAAYPSGKVNLEEARAAAVVKASQRRERLLEGMREKINRILIRLEKKEELLKKSKEGSKAKLKYTTDADKIRNELETAQKALKDAEEKSLSNISHKLKDTSPLLDTICLSNAQTKAYNEIKKAFASDKPVLLHGITGSGKTEIYIKLAIKTISQGRNVLYLVPEIALSRQLEERLSTHFEDRLMVFHSGESSASKRNTAEFIRSCSEKSINYIILGTRSSLFLPHHNLGLIIVDEEHDNSYKQDSPAPRYNGRDTALMMSVIHGSNILLGSATPSLEELYNCLCKKHIQVKLTERYHGTADPEIEVIDTQAERRKRGMRGNFSIKLINSINKTLADGGQVMILRSRRAWSPALQCEGCGKIVKCPNCNVSLTLHQTGTAGRMVCHYCGYQTTFTGSCTSCAGVLKPLGAGTQKIESEAAELFPQARIARLDSDSAQNKNYEIQTIKSFSNGDIDILIGTQMLTKGFDFSNLRLVAVISADTLLGLQDFRADEKAIQILEQFRGRCGRRDLQGKFIIQTSQPEHPVYQHIRSNNENTLSINLLTERKEFDFPPFTRIVEVTVKDSVEERANKMSNSLGAMISAHFSIIGPYAPAVDKIAGQTIRTIRISMKKDKELLRHKALLKDIIISFEKKKRYDGHITVNVDPI